MFWRCLGRFLFIFNDLFKGISVGIRNIVFEVKTVLQSQQEKSTDSSEKIVSHGMFLCLSRSWL